MRGEPTPLPHILDALNGDGHVFAAELRPPRARLARAEGMNAWIDTYHSIVGLARRQRYVCLTDGAVGAAEEDNLRHLVANLQRDVPRERIVPFLTTKHTRAYCLEYAERARLSGFPALVVLGGDRTVGPPRCVEHAYELRQAIRARAPDLILGGWANPHADPGRQVRYLADAQFNAEFALTQIVSHHDAAVIDRFLAELRRQRVALPIVLGVFYYRSARPRTLAMLREFLPVPVEALTREFAEGHTPVEICARTIRRLIELGAQHFYVSNLPLATAARTLDAVIERALPGSRAGG